MRIILIFSVLSILFSCKADLAIEKMATPSVKAEQKKVPVSPPKVEEASISTVRNAKESIRERSVAAKPKASAKANTKIDYQNVDLTLMENLIHEEINKVRKVNRLPILERDEVLRNAAVNQNNYQLTVNELTHTQRTPGKKELIDRVKFYGGGFQLLAENLIYEGFTVRTMNGKVSQIITPTYREMAKTITVNWMKSPTHKRNIMQKSLKLVGTAAAYNAKNHAIYATQVFGTRF